VTPWTSVLAAVPDVVASYLPGSVLDARLRELALATTADRLDATACRTLHRPWADFVGVPDDELAAAAVVDFARRSADAGEVVDRRDLEAALSADESRAVASLVGFALAIARAGRGPVGSTLMAPLAAPMAAAATVLTIVNRLAPRLPADRAHDDQENLLTVLLGHAIRAWLANAGVRLVVLRLPVTLVIGVRAGRTSSTVRVGRGRVDVEDGIAPDAVVVVDGEIEPLLRQASGRLARQLGGIRIRPT
jgi:hypothetical protein